METLVLNPGYEPVARVPWQRAVTLLFLGKVEVVEEYDDKEIRSVTFVFVADSCRGRSDWCVRRVAWSRNRRQAFDSVGGTARRLLTVRHSVQ